MGWRWRWGLGSEEGRREKGEGRREKGEGRRERNESYTDFQ
jgi:hypothetical protein